MHESYPGTRRSTVSKGVTILLTTYILFIVGLRIDTLYDIVVRLFPLLIIVSLIILLYYQKHWNIRSLSFLFVIFFGGFFVQAIASETKLIYGEFFYGNTLGPKLFDTPILTGVIWLLLIYSAGCTIKNLKIGLMAQCLLGSFLLVLIDVLMEPVAKYMDFWSWKKDVIPFQNYFAWFVISFFMFLYCFNLKAKLRNEIAAYIFVIIAAFFLVLNIVVAK